MKFCGAILVFLLCGAISVTAQRSKPVRKKLPVIRATVTVKGDGNHKPPEYVDESAAAAWNLFEMPEHALKISAPAKTGDFEHEKTKLEDGAVWEYSTYTKNAVYSLMIRDYDSAPLRHSGEILDDLIDRYFYAGDPRFKVVSRRNFTYSGADARELIIHAGDTVKKHRVLFLNGKLFALTVSVEPRALWPKAEKWADKFLDSFDVKVSPLDEG